MKKILTILLLLSLCLVQAIEVTFLDEEKDKEIDSEAVSVPKDEEADAEVVNATKDGEANAEAVLDEEEIEESQILSQQSSLGAQEALKEARALAKEARKTYAGVAFSIDQPLWRSTLHYLDLAINAEPTNLEVLRFAVEVYTELGWHSRAWLYWERYLEAGGERDQKLAAKVGESATELGYSRYQSGDMQGALDYYKEILSKDRNNSEAILGLARIYFEQGQPRKALPFWQVAAKRKLSEGADYFLERTKQQITHGVAASNAFYEGMGFYEKGNLVAAQEEFNKAKQANTDFKEAWAWLGRTSLELQQPRLAQQAWRRVTELDPNDDGAKYFLQVSTDQLTWGVSVVDSRANHGLQTFQVNNPFDRGVQSYQIADFNSAKEYFLLATKEEPNHSEAWGWLGRIHFEQGEYDEAINYYNKALKLDPNNDNFLFFVKESKRLLKIER